MEPTLASEVVATSFIVSSFMAAGVLLFIWYVLLIIANWRIFTKAGEPGWKSLIPIYNYYILLKICKMRNWFWWVIGSSICAGVMYVFDGSNPLLMTEEQLAVYDWGAHPMALFATVMISVVSIYTQIVSCYRLSKAFGHGIGFTFGLILLQPIFEMILGYGPSKYNKKLLSK